MIIGLSFPTPIIYLQRVVNVLCIGHHPDKVADPACGQMNRETDFFLFGRLSPSRIRLSILLVVR